MPRKKDGMTITGRRANAARQDKPTRKTILEFIQSSTTKVSRREIARAFNIRSSDQGELRHILSELRTGGLIADKKRKLRKDRLPPVAVLVIQALDANGAGPAAHCGERVSPTDPPP